MSKRAKKKKTEEMTPAELEAEALRVQKRELDGKSESDEDDGHRAPPPPHAVGGG